LATGIFKIGRNQRREFCALSRKVLSNPEINFARFLRATDREFPSAGRYGYWFDSVWEKEFFLAA
jgi:hypothetical protein